MLKVESLCGNGVSGMVRSDDQFNSNAVIDCMKNVMMAPRCNAMAQRPCHITRAPTYRHDGRHRKNQGAVSVESSLKWYTL